MDRAQVVKNQNACLSVCVHVALPICAIAALAIKANVSLGDIGPVSELKEMKRAAKHAIPPAIQDHCKGTGTRNAMISCGPLTSACMGIFVCVLVGTGESAVSVRVCRFACVRVM